MSKLTFGKRHKMSMVLQAEAAECGLCCIAMVAGFYGSATDLVTLRQTLGASLRGVTLKTLIDLADTIGLSSRPLRLELDELKLLQLPAILHWNFDHFVVLSKVKGNLVTLYDPAVGIRKYTLAQVNNRFTGVALELTARRDFKTGESTDKLSIWKFWQGEKGLVTSLVQIFFLSFLLQVFSLASPFFMQTVVDEVLIKQDADLLLVLALGFLCLSLISVFTGAIRSFAGLYLENQFSYNIGNSVLHHLIRLPMKWFENRHIGDILSHFESISQIQDFITGSVITVCLDGLLATTTLVLMWIYSPMLSCIVIASFVLYGVFRALQFRPLRNANHESIVASAKLDSIFMETIRGVQGVKLAHKEIQRQTTWRNQFSETINTAARIGRLTISYETANGVLEGCENILVIYVAATAVLEGAMTVGMMYAFLAYRSNFKSAMGSLINLLVQYWMLGLHLERIADITQAEKEPEPNSLLVLPLSGKLVINDLAFHYEKTGKAIFSKFTIAIQSKQFVAIVGPSGIGKTTLLKVMMGLIAPSQGEISADGMLLSAIGNKSYRQSIAVVMQDDTLFSGSLLDNIAFFDNQPSRGRVEEACKLAMVHADIMSTPMGYDSIISDMGSSFSVGQQQRMLIARAIYSNPKLLFMDEGTAHVDSKSELQIMNNLKAQGFTCIYITHNEQLLSLADQVVHWPTPGRPEAACAEISKLGV